MAKLHQFDFIIKTKIVHVKLLEFAVILLVADSHNQGFYCLGNFYNCDFQALKVHGNE